MRSIGYACSSIPPFDKYAVIPVARNVWQHVKGGSPAAASPPLDHRKDHPPFQSQSMRIAAKCCFTVGTDPGCVRM